MDSSGYSAHSVRNGSAPYPGSNGTGTPRVLPDRIAAVNACHGEGVADISSRDDCERLVRAFYTRAFADPLIGFLFTDVARLDLEAHVPRITSFWETILLGARSYGGGAFR